MVGITMSRIIAILACGVALGACSMSMPSLDFFKGSPATETLRVESEPPGADARTTQGQSCRTPCELVVTSGTEMAVSFALNGYQPTTIQVRPDSPPSAYGETGPARLQPNPVYAELQPMKPPPPAKRKAQPRKKQLVQKGAQPAPPAQSGAAADPNSAYPAGYPWPDPAPSR